MADFDEIDDFESEVSALERSLGDVSAVGAAFTTQLQQMDSAMRLTSSEMGKLQSGFSGGLRRAFDGLIFDGTKLSDALATVAKSMADTACSMAIKPVTDQLGGLLAQGVGALFGGVTANANGNAFSQGQVMPFAKGGIVSGATMFPMRGGVGLMGEAGPEAIMPLARGADGRLGVRAAGGSSVHVTMNVTTPDVQGFARSQSQIAAQMSRAITRGQRNR
ncbi:MAG: phage tail tape measure protein [Rhodobacteraceae bacterium]|nr:phage tail tape measure protein [Paracoccaceae bacterium]